MKTPKENFLALINGEKTDAFVNSWEPFGFVFDPLMASTLVAKPGVEVVDPWGVTVFMEDGGTNGVMPIVTPEKKVCTDITCWRDQVHAPDLEALDLDWTAAKEQAEAIRAQGKLVTSLMATGLFEQSHYLMGFEDTLVNVLMEPEDMADLVEYLCEYKMAYAKLLVENLHPDVILSHDDWGTKISMFMQPDTWREIYKPCYEKFYGYLKDNGIIVIHHSDSFCEPIVPDMIDLGIDVWQGVLPQNDIKMLQEKYAGQIVFMGGIDAQLIDVSNWTEDLVRTEVRRACEEYTPAGSFIPCLTYGGEGSIFPGVNDVIMDEVRSLSPSYF
jgi:hypothetical protein